MDSIPLYVNRIAAAVPTDSNGDAVTLRSAWDQWQTDGAAPSGRRWTLWWIRSMGFRWLRKCDEAPNDPTVELPIIR